MKITVRGYLTYQNSLGSQELELMPGSSLQDLLDQLQSNPDFKNEMDRKKPVVKTEENFIILLNGIHIRHLPARENTMLKDGDQVSIFPPMVGG